MLNPINLRLTPDDIAFILDHSASKVVFYHADFAPLVNRIVPGLAARPACVVMESEARGVADYEYETLLASASADEPPTEVDENAVAELFYTSGTTGRPKGVALTHRALYLHGLQTALSLGVTDVDTILHVVPLLPRERLGGTALDDACGRPARHAAPLRPRNPDVARGATSRHLPAGRPNDLQRRAEQPGPRQVRPLEPAAPAGRRCAIVAHT